MAINVSAGNFQMCVVQAEDISSLQDERLGDLSAVTGSIFNEQSVLRLSNAISTDMADVGKVVITSDRTTLLIMRVTRLSALRKLSVTANFGEFHYKNILASEGLASMLLLFRSLHLNRKLK